MLMQKDGLNWQYSWTRTKHSRHPTGWHQLQHWCRHIQTLALDWSLYPDTHHHSQPPALHIPTLPQVTQSLWTLIQHAGGS